MKKLYVAAAVSAALMMSQAAQAATATGTLTVKATITSSCAVNTSSTGTVTNAVLDFGTVSSFASNVNASTSSNSGAKLGVLCNTGTAWTMSFGSGSNVSSSQRRMAGGTSEYVPYNLYSDSAYSTAVGIDTAALSGTGTGSQQTYDIYGRIPAGTTLPSASTYTDTVAITLTY